MEVTPPRHQSQDEKPLAPRKPLRRRAARTDDDMSCRVKRRLVFERESDESISSDEDRDVKSPDNGHKEASGITHCVHSCACSPESKHLLCCELVSVGGTISFAECPICKMPNGGVDKTNSNNTRCSDQLSDGCDRDACSWSDDSVIVSPFPGLKCYITTFNNIVAPTLLDTGGSYLPVYAPYNTSFCQQKCIRREECGSSLIGKGSFGQVWKLSDKLTAVKIAGESIDETMLTIWVSGVVRARAQDAGYSGELWDSVYCNILTATGCCLKHNLVSFTAFDRDMYNYKGWSFSGLDSYQRAFAGLADAIRFLNLRCEIAHFDITPMNVLVKYDKSDDAQITRAVLCDFSLSQCHAEGNAGHCVVVFEETRTVRALHKSTYHLTDIYHPAFKPIPLQKMCTVNPRIQFPNPSSQRFCVSDLCALGNVAAFCMLRILDDRGQMTVRSTSENALFCIAKKTCDALSKHNIDDVANYCSLLVTRQLAYTAAILGSDEMKDVLNRLCEFFVTVSDEGAADRFKTVYKKARLEIDGSHTIRRVREALDTEAGLYMIENIRSTCLAVDLDDFNADPHSIFP
nr:tegument serine/threonine protein kinase [Mastomys natalensis cytomegalovirus 3]WEG69923.1 tegument serine/threonine protein kinase [Mastomys natalensis cytomegalovirus 3]WEG70063.1 tegument serine/threonine protein kinase [Mastomys natalensis cytomegalovirus 3]WEG70203.1 tegument serine/threonine protein kinase [Mastomys natalensis cytomegalovirus 3]WEG70343.1 tegument serine/threonine protein kinase [Mastomys natalensis cytomegalovirus 3]